MENAKYGRKSHRKAGTTKSKITKITSMKTTRQFFKTGSKNDEYCRKWIETYQQMLSTISYYEYEKENFRKKYGD